MSQFFLARDQVLWNPASAVAALFLRSAQALEPEVRLPSGLGPMQEDECHIDLESFAAFIEALVIRFERSNHTVQRSLMEGFIATSLVLIDRAGVAAPATAPPDATHPWGELRQSHARAMAR